MHVDPRHLLGYPFDYIRQQVFTRRHEPPQPQAGTNMAITWNALGPILAATGSGSLTKLGTATVAGAAATTLTLSGLDLSAYRAFLVIFDFDNATGSNSTVSLYFNADTTATNYNIESISFSNTTVAATRANSGAIDVLSANETGTGFFIIRNDQNGRPRAMGLVNDGASASIIGRLMFHSWTSATNVTGLTFSGSVATSLAIGSTFTVYGIAL